MERGQAPSSHASKQAVYLVILAWGYVVVMMALAEAMSPQGTLLGAFFTLLLYGVGPMALVIYLMGTPLRRKARRQQEAAEAAEAAARASAQQTPDAPVSATESTRSHPPDGRNQAPAAAEDARIAPVGKEP